MDSRELHGGGVKLTFGGDGENAAYAMRIDLLFNKIRGPQADMDARNRIVDISLYD